MSAGFDPKLLLDPKGAASRKAPPAQAAASGPSNSPYRSASSNPVLPQHVNHSASMIERMHNIQDRQDAPRKRQKTTAALGEHDDDDDVVELQRDKAHFQVHGKGGTMSKGLGEARDQAAKRGKAQVTVDLTTVPSDDDDVVIVQQKTSYDEIVCLGRIDNARVNAHQVPTPKMQGLVSNNTSAKHWLPMAVTLRRRAGTNTAIIGVIDAAGKDFGTIDVRTANVLAPLLDNQYSQIRVQARLDMRVRKPFEVPGMTTSDNYGIILNVYAPRKMVNGIGKIFSQKSVFFRTPSFVEHGILIANPHAPKDFSPCQTQKAKVERGSRYSSASGTVMRTQEEIKQDVTRIFDCMRTTAEPPEAAQPAAIKTPLLPHQKQALHFMTMRENDDLETDSGLAETEASLWRKDLRPNGSNYWYHAITGQQVNAKPHGTQGGLLADVMGLGKTLNCLSLIMSTRDEANEFAKHEPQEPEYEEDETDSDLQYNHRGTLVVCPVSTVSNWEEQISRHIQPKEKPKVLIYHGPKRTNEAQELDDYDMVITTYSTISADYKSRSRSRPNNPLAEVNWFRIVLDEAHMIREQNTRQSKAVCNLSAQRRWAVTGTPVQNRLDDLGALLKFLKVRPFDNPRNFAQYIISPFKLADTDIIEKLQVLVNSITLRRLKDKLDLPGRDEKIVRLEMSDSERDFYEFFSLDSQKKVQAMTAGRQKIGGSTYAHVLRAILRLRLLCAHGADLLSDEDYDYSKGFSSFNAIDLEAIDDKTPDKTPRQAFEMFRMIRDANVNYCASCQKLIVPREISDYDLEDDDDEERDIFGYLTACNQLICEGCIGSFEKNLRKTSFEDGWGHCSICETYIRAESSTCLKSKEMAADEDALRILKANPKLAKHHCRYSGPHTKVKTLIRSLQADADYSMEHCPTKPIKSVVFSGWTNNLDLIQIGLTDAQIRYTRLDGSMKRTSRAEAMEEFRTSKDVCVLLISLGAGGLGLNLTAASRVYVMEPQFNPAAEAQAIERVHRLGQTRDVIITRYIMNKSFEEKMLLLQAKKKALANLSVSKERMKGSKDELRSRLDDLRELFK